MLKSFFFRVLGCHQPLFRWITPGGTFHWHDYLTAEISQPPANSFTPHITHTFKVFIIKRIRLCSFNIFPPWSPFQGSAWLRFISTQPQRDWLFHWLFSHPPPGRRCFFVSWLSGGWVQRSLQTPCHKPLCEVSYRLKEQPLITTNTNNTPWYITYYSKLSFCLFLCLFEWWPILAG